MKENNLEHDTVVNLIPPARPTYAQYWNDTENDSRYVPISYIAITKDGEMRGVVMADGYFDFCDRENNYRGMVEYHKEGVWLSENDIRSRHGFNGDLV